MRLNRYKKNPILSPNPANAWESLVATNPGAWYDEKTGEVKLLYRAAGNDPEHRIYFGLAVSKNGYDFRRVSDEPVFGPSADGFDAGNVQDARVTQIGDWYYITYACKPYPGGQYWLPMAKRTYSRPQFPDTFPRYFRDFTFLTALALTQDFQRFYRVGPITDPLTNDHDVILFPEKTGGRFYMLQRPMEWHGPGFPNPHPAIWIASGEDVMKMGDSTLVAQGQYDWECKGKIGANTVPLKTEAGWLVIYHAVGADKRYRLGALLLDLDEPWKVRRRTKDFIFQPEEPYETKGIYNGCVFPCGKVLLGDDLLVYYGAADQHVGVASCKLKELLDYLDSCPN
ncbi:MAG: glycosidase [Candidatus Sumerlaeota bacterium]|nr:glycosidase [Candidatus Sumerlaeota bacterium]